MNLNQIIRNGFTDNLGEDFLAIDAAGVPFARASSREALDTALRSPGQPVAEMIVTAADLNPPPVDGGKFDRDGDGKVGGSPKQEAVLVDDPIEQLAGTLTKEPVKAQAKEPEHHPAKKAAPKK